jgi:hypothetical protein
MAKDFVMEMWPEKSETMAFLGQDPSRCKIIVDNVCEIFYIYQLWIVLWKWKTFQQIRSKFSQILWIINNTFKPTLIQKS